MEQLKYWHYDKNTYYGLETPKQIFTLKLRNDKNLYLYEFLVTESNIKIIALYTAFTKLLISESLNYS